jgi:hypothetical protein
MPAKRLEDIAVKVEDKRLYEVEVFKVRHEYETTFVPGRKYVVKGKVVKALGEDVRVLGEKVEKVRA